MLREKLAATKEGEGGLVRTGGEAAREALGQGFMVFEGHCCGLAETPPYGAWGDLFAQMSVPTSLPPPPKAFIQRGTVGSVGNQMVLFAQPHDAFDVLSARHADNIPVSIVACACFAV